jgi:sugar/nucleoside kinase (ribokinase family)
MAVVVCVGIATLDTILLVPSLPEPDGHVRVRERAVAGGGPAATAAVTLARLGVDAAFVGAVGDDDVGETIRAGLAEEGVDVREVRVVPGAVSPQSTILVEEPTGARAIVHYPGTMPPLELTPSARDLVERATWVHADQVGYRAVRGLKAQISLDGGNPIDGLDLSGIALYAPTEAELERRFGSVDEALDAGAATVVVTRGERGSSAATRDGARFEAAGVPAETTSTLGAGDVFHGALLAALVRGASLEDALASANLAAALSCRGLDGRSAIPTLDELERSAA